MRRRTLLSAAAATLLAGCGWSQDPQTVDDPNEAERNGNEKDTERGDETEGNGEGENGGERTAESLPRSEGRETAIEAQPEALLLTAEAFERERWAELGEWNRTEKPSTNPCRYFEQPGLVEHTVESCALVLDDEEAATAEYESIVDRGDKLNVIYTVPLEPLDVGLTIGSDTSVFWGGFEGGQNELAVRCRIVFRDANAVGILDYREHGPGQRQTEPRELRDVAGLAVAMHERWRE